MTTEKSLSLLPPPPLRMSLKDHGVWDVLKKGGTNTLFRISQPPMHIVEMIFLSKIADSKPLAWAAGAQTFVIKNFVTHLVGAFLHLLPIKFDETSKEKSANLFYAAYITVTGLNTLMLPVMIVSGKILVYAFGQNSTISDYSEDFFRAFAFGSYPIQWFSVNRQFMNSLCGDTNYHKADENYKFMMPVVGFIELGIYSAAAYYLIMGNGGFPQLGNAGSGIAFSASAWAAFLISSGILLVKKSFREYILQKPNASLIKHNIAMIFRDHAPVATRYLIDSMSWIALAQFAGKISEQSLTALQLSLTLLLPVSGPCFSFIHGARALLRDSLDFRTTALITLAIPLTYSLLYLVPLSIPPVIRSVSDLLLQHQTPENREAIKDIVQNTAPILAATEVVGCVALEERVIETWGAQQHEKQNTRLVAKENWIITGNTLAIQGTSILFAYVAGLKLDLGLPGMVAVYLIFMIGLLLALAPRTINFLRNPSKPPQSCWTSFHQPEETYKPIHTRTLDDLPEADRKVFVFN